MRTMVIHLGAPLPVTSSNQPGSTDGPSLTLPYLVLLLVGFTWHPTSPPNPVSSYLTLSPLPDKSGGLLSVALSLGSPPLDVIQHHALRSPDFPPHFHNESAATAWSAPTKPYLLDYILLPLLENKYPLTVGTGYQLFSAVKVIVHLRRDLHVATETTAVTSLHDSNPSSGFTELFITLENTGRDGLRPLGPGLGIHCN